MAQARPELTPSDDGSGVPIDVQDRIAQQLFGPGDDAGQEPQEGDRDEEHEEAPAQSDAGEEGSREVEGADDGQQGDEGEDGQGTRQALEEVDWQGQRYQLPKPIKDALMARADYTRGMQEYADLRRAIDLERIQQQHLAQFNDAVSEEVGKRDQLQWQLQAYRALDWTTMDNETATKANIQVSRLRDELAEVEKSLGQKKGQFDREMMQLHQQAIQRGDEYLRRHVKNWSPQVDRSVKEYGLVEGYSDVEMQMLTDARMKKTLWKAMQFDRIMKRANAEGQRRVQRPAPGLSVRGATSNQTARQIADSKYKAAMKSAKTSSEKAALIQDRLAAKLFGP